MANTLSATGAGEPAAKVLQVLSTGAKKMGDSVSEDQMRKVGTREMGAFSDRMSVSEVNGVRNRNLSGERLGLRGEGDLEELAQFYITVLAQAAVQWNAQSLLGSYAIEGDQLTHRTRLSLNGQGPAEETAEQINAADTLVYKELSRRSRAAHALAAGTARA